jgi:hypothetical protein
MKTNTRINIISTAPTKDSEGFVTKGDTIIATVRAFKEIKSATEKSANMSIFSTETVSFKFRRILKVEIGTSNIIAEADVRYNILSVDTLSSRGMYVSVIAEKVEGSG